MGINYYYHYNTCPHCKRHDEIHIGKQSHGWSFSFRGHPEEWNRGCGGAYPEISSFEDWKRFFAEHLGEIVRCGGKMDVKDFIAMVDRDSGGKKHAQECPSEYSKMSKDGYSFTFQEFS